MTTTTKTPRITKAMKFDAIIALIQGNPVPHGLTADNLIEFVKNEKALLAKKNNAERKPTAKQKDNEILKERIFEFLMDCPEGATCTDIRKGVPELSEYETQKAASLANAMVHNNRLRKAMVKGRAVFSVA